MALGRSRPALWQFTLATALLAGLTGTLSGSTFGTGSVLDSLTVKGVTYHHVQVRDVNAHSLFFLSDRTFVSVRLADLSPALQEAFGYSSEADAEASAAEAAQVRALAAGAGAAAAPGSAVRSGGSPRSDGQGFEGVLRRFGEAPELRSEVDLRDRFNGLGLFVKNQGRRPSCAIFAVVSALEYQYAGLVGHPEELSEEYVTWATRKVLGRDRVDTTGSPRDGGDDDLGFALEDVVVGVRTYGVPGEGSMPDRRDSGMSAIADPSPALIEEARRHCAVAVYPIPARDDQERLGNIVTALNAEVPVVIGLPWPSYGSIRSGFLDRQPPLPAALGGGYHAVTLVGYRCPGGALDQAVFIFKNSWGAQWGEAGYGQVTARYLLANPPRAILLEIRKAAG